MKIDMRHFNLGRPSIPMKERKCHIVTAVLNHRQWKKLRDAVNANGGNQSDFLRFLIDTVLK